MIGCDVIQLFQRISNQCRKQCGKGRQSGDKGAGRGRKGYPHSRTASPRSGRGAERRLYSHATVGGRRGVLTGNRKGREKVDPHHSFLARSCCKKVRISGSASCEIRGPQSVLRLLDATGTLTIQMDLC